MILLEPGSRVADFVTSEASNSVVNLADFDGVTYRISILDDKITLLLSMAMVCFKNLEKFGASKVLAREYGGNYQAKPEAGYDVTLRIDLSKLPKNRDDLIKSCALLKRTAMAAPFEAAFEAQTQDTESELMTIPYRIDENIYIKAMQDRVTVIFSTKFKEETDRIFGKVFLQEFVDARRLPHIQNAPQVLYSREPPLELRHLNLGNIETDGFVTFVLFPRHYLGSMAFDCISKIQLFRDYFHYHIKASKAYMHSRMRTRVDGFLKVINRAKPEIQTEQKTASGKTFKRS